MLFTKWRFLFNIISNSRNPSFVKVDLKEGPADNTAGLFLYSFTGHPF